MNRERLFRTEILFLLILLITIGGCDIINPAEPIPTRIQLEPFDLNLQPNQGSEQSKITEIWVFDEANLIGVFSPNVEISYLGNKDNTKFSFRPGIRNNGITNDAIIYPLYTNFDITLPSTPGSHSSIHPVTHYKQGVVVGLNADFESGNEFIYNRDTVSASNLIRTMDNPFEGNYSGEIVLSQAAYFIDVGNGLPIGGLPTDGTPTYLEFQYKSEVDLNIGLLGIQLDGQSFSNFFYLVLPSENWNMLYIDLTDELKISSFPAYKILFSASYPSDATKPEYKIELDNIKIVHL